MRTNRKFVHNLSDAEIRSIFVDQMRLHGLIFDGPDLPIMMDGRTRYVRVEGRSRGKKNARSGWYSGHLGDFPNGRFGWLHGEAPLHTWSLYQHLKDKNGSVDFVELTEEQVIESEKKRQREEKRRLEQEKQRLAFSKAYTIIEWVRSLPLNQHPYLTKKKFSIAECEDHARILNTKNYTVSEVKTILDEHFPEYNKPSNIRKLMDYQDEHVTYRGYNILLRGEVITAEPMMLQFIFDKKSKAGKDKHFPRELVKQNTLLNLGKKLDDTCHCVIICEGWATGISITRFTHKEMPVLVAWDSGNMTAVAIEVRRKYPNMAIYSASDNDHTKPLEKNAGIRGGLKTCNAVTAYMVTPPFDSTNADHENLSDWNDIDNYYPPAESSRIFHETFNNAVAKSAIYDDDYLLLKSNESSYSIKDDEIEVQDGPMWQTHFITMARLICKGIQHCRYTEDEQLGMYMVGYLQINDYVQQKGLDQQHRIYDVSLDLKLSDLFHDFVLALHSSENHIMHDIGLMKELLKQIKILQTKIPSLNLLHTVRDVIAERYSLETANLCIPYHLGINHYYGRSHKQWMHDVAQALQGHISEINPLIAFPLILNTKEIKYWAHLLPSDRVEQACIEITEAYNQHPSAVLDDSELLEQINRTRYLQSCLTSHLTAPTDHSIHHLSKVVDRLNELGPCSIELNQLTD